MEKTIKPTETPHKSALIPRPKAQTSHFEKRVELDLEFFLITRAEVYHATVRNKAYKIRKIVSNYRWLATKHAFAGRDLQLGGRNFYARLS